MAEKVLIVDDDLETLRLVGLMLQKQGFTIVVANNGGQALSMAAQELPDVIVLDVMMPDIDGFTVTRQLRKDPATAGIPILMFTAKGMVEDKVTGYEAGADDYLTKPIHPVELVARVRALLGRTKTRIAPEVPQKSQGYTIGVLAPKGGVGASSLALNLAISYSNKTSGDVIAVEMRPGHGTWGLELGYAAPTGLADLLKKKPSEINRQTIESELVATTYGPRLLFSSPRIKDTDGAQAVEQMEAILKVLPQISPLILLDIGANLWPNLGQMVNYCQEVIVITEPYPWIMPLTKIFLEDLAQYGFGKTKILSLVMVNRVRADMQLTVTQVQERLGVPVAQVIPPATEVAYQAALRNLPLIQIQPGGLLAQQFTRLAEMIAPRVKK